MRRTAGAHLRMVPSAAWRTSVGTDGQPVALAASPGQPSAPLCCAVPAHAAAVHGMLCQGRAPSAAGAGARMRMWQATGHSGTASRRSRATLLPQLRVARMMAGACTWADQPHECRQHQGQVLLKGQSKGLQRAQRGLHGAVVAAALSLCDDGRKAREQLRQVPPDVVPQRLCACARRARSAQHGTAGTAWRPSRQHAPADAAGVCCDGCQAPRMPLRDPLRRPAALSRASPAHRDQPWA